MAITHTHHIPSVFVGAGHAAEIKQCLTVAKMLRNNWDFNPAFFSLCFGTSSLLNKTKLLTNLCKRSLVNPTGCPCSNQNLTNDWSGPALWKTKPCCCKFGGNSQGQPEASRPDVVKLNKSSKMFFILGQVCSLPHPSQKYWNRCWNYSKKQITVGTPMYSSIPSACTVHTVATLKNCNLLHAADVSMVGSERAKYWSSPFCTGVSSQEMPAWLQKPKDRTILSLSTSLNTSPCCKRLPIQKHDKSWKPFAADERNATIAAAALASARFEAGLTFSKSGRGFLLSSSMTLLSCFVANPATWSKVNESNNGHFTT